MSLTSQLVVFSLDGCRYGLPLENVERVVRAVEVTPIPELPEVVVGAVDVAGAMRPVISLRQKFRKESASVRSVRVSDHFILAHSSHRALVLLVDDVEEVTDVAVEMILKADEMIDGKGAVQGFVKLESGLIVICDLERCLTPDQELALDRTAAGGRGAYDA
jgi:purine-binding chemotaxis protein CheW